VAGEGAITRKKGAVINQGFGCSGPLRRLLFFPTCPTAKFEEGHGLEGFWKELAGMRPE
jgi:hypothetical protein